MSLTHRIVRRKYAVHYCFILCINNTIFIEKANNLTGIFVSQQIFTYGVCLYIPF